MTTIPNPVDYPVGVPNAIDYLKYTLAECYPMLESACDSLADLCENETLVDEVASTLSTVKALLGESTAVFCRDGDDMNTYSDGRPVTTSIKLADGNTFSYTWHPQSSHPHNQPCTLGPIDGLDGVRELIAIERDGVINAVPTGLRAVK